MPAGIRSFDGGSDRLTYFRFRQQKVKIIARFIHDASHEQPGYANVPAIIEAAKR
jgi:hypothetical protein